MIDTTELRKDIARAKDNPEVYAHQLYCYVVELAGELEHYREVLETIHYLRRKP